MFCHPARAVGSHRSSPPAAGCVRTKSTGGFTILMGHPVEGTQSKCELLPYLELSQHVDHQRETQSQGGNAGNCHGDVVVLEEHLHGISLFLFCMLLGQVATFLPHPKLILHGNNLQLPLTWFRHFWRLVGRTCSYLLPRHYGVTSQI